MGTALFIRQLQPKGLAFQSLYKLDPPMVVGTKAIELVVVSGVLEAFDTGLPETMIFEGSKDGIVDHTALSSLIGECSHAKALANVGYKLIGKSGY